MQYTVLLQCYWVPCLHYSHLQPVVALGEASLLPCNTMWILSIGPVLHACAATECNGGHGNVQGNSGEYHA